jgi:hypothetical protein
MDGTTGHMGYESAAVSEQFKGLAIKIGQSKRRSKKAPDKK